MKELKGLRVYFVGIKIPLDVLEEREKERGTSPVGHARSHYDSVHTGMTYDIELNTSQMNPEQCAEKIENFIESNHLSSF